ncbi:histidine kinase [Rhodococcus sp. H29-C3]|uniref:sensor histidine kinase n=1 Tax=Rhodococcus sp. H29-C3 TaxID=3046307 RepID=UPI0024BA782F|nr:histidine kinase [Rhodococcus sp. H29-C3]MDJ0363307.1 histidine kinase [Rhodococcus sp. H29-C3]
MSGRGSQPVRVLAAGVYPQAWLVTGVILSLVAGQGMRGVVPPWAVALCVVAAAVAGVAGRRARHVGGAAAILGAGVVSAIALSAVTGSSWSVTLLVVGLACGAPWLGGRYLHQQDELADEAAQRARLQERSRIAQDMHDSLGHELNLLALRAGAIEMDTTLTSRHQGAASELRAGASLAITQLAAVIGMLRGDGPVAWGPTSPDIAGLVRRAADAGMDMTLERNGPEDAAIPVVRCIHRVIQEGITNAARHAPGSAVTVKIDSSAEETQVTVINTPPNMSLRRRPGSQTGFVALKERLQACGGTLSAGPHHGGFRLIARVPRGGAG